jgi:hypothetical protein
MAVRERDADPREPLAGDQERKELIGSDTTLQRTQGLIRGQVEAQWCQRLRGGRPDRRQVAAHGNALHPPRRVRGERQTCLRKTEHEQVCGEIV